MRYAYDKSTTRIVSCKSNLQLACDCRVRHEECRGLLKHVLKPYDNRSDRQFDIVEIIYDFSMTRAARATKIACDNRKQKSYRVNRPLCFFYFGLMVLLAALPLVDRPTFGRLRAARKTSGTQGRFPAQRRACFVQNTTLKFTRKSRQFMKVHIGSDEKFSSAL